MSMHLIAFSESQDAGGALTYMAGVPDQSIQVRGDDLVVPDVCNKLFGAMGFLGTAGVYAQLVSPSLRVWSPYLIQPNVLGLVPGTPQRAYLHPGSPLQLQYNEALNAQFVADPGAAEQESIIVFLADKIPQKVDGNIIKVFFNVTVAQSAGLWVNAPITFPNLLPTGKYRCVGASLVMAGAVAARFYPVGDIWRPGFPVSQTAAGQQDDIFRNGNLGDWFTFDQTQPPSIDILGSAAAGSATYRGVMDLIPV